MAITVKQIKKLEQHAHKLGLFTKDLMQNAGKAVFHVIEEKLECDDKRFIIFCGSGNNAGDGFVAAKHLAEKYSVLILLFGDMSKFSDETTQAYEDVKETIPIIEVRTQADLDEFHLQPNHHHILVDALLGTGCDGTVRKPYDLAIHYFNSLKAEKVSIDIPSGMNADTGDFSLRCESDLIITLHDIKQGMVGLETKTVIVDIGIPHEGNE